MSVAIRDIIHQVKDHLGKYPIVALTGPRQSGKTTLLKKFLPDYRYVSLENADQRAFAKQDPAGFLKKFDSKVIFDEVQRSPHLFSYLQTLVDESGQMGQFILSGSQNFHLLSRITQSLAGRVAIFKLMPFDSSELVSAKMSMPDWKSQILKGFYPAIYDRDLDSSVYYSNYLQTYVNRDIADLTRVQDTKRFKNFVQMCAARAGQLLNLNSLANACGITQPTARSWLSILEASYIVFLLQPYHENFNKRIVKSPKLYFYDSGLLSFLLGLRKVDDLNDQKLLGHLFENMIVADIMKRNYHQNLLRDYWFWRDSGGHEIDLLTKTGNQFDIFEIKSSQTILSKLTSGLDYFDKITRGAVRSKTLVYGGEKDHDRSDFKVRTWRELDLEI